MPDEHLLLAYIEDELGADEADRLRASLADRPQLLAALDAMRADRAALRDLPQPALPRDFAAELEPLLARSMLVETRPGAYRRRYHRRRRRRQIARLAVAAALLVGLGTGAVMAWREWVPPLDGRAPFIAADDDGDNSLDPIGDRLAGGAVPEQTPEAPALDPAENIVDPAAMLAIAPEPPAVPLTAEAPAANVAPAEPPLVIAVTPAGEPVALPFALRLVAGEGGGAEQAVLAALEGLETPATLVRNFSIDEARRLEEQWRREQRGRGSAPAAIASLDGRSGALRRGDLDEVIRRITQQMQRPAGSGDRAGAAPPPTGRAIRGPAELTAPLAQQILYAQRGADHTVTIHVGALQALLARLDRQPALRSALCLLPEPPAEGAPPAPAADPADWVSDLGRIRAAVHDLQQRDPNALVMLAVISG